MEAPHTAPPEPSSQPELWSDDMLPEGWELLLTREQKERSPGRYTLERIQRDEQRVQAIIASLGAGFSAREVCRALHVHHRVVSGLLGVHQEAIDALKKRTQRKMLRTAELCVDFVREQLLAGEMSGRDASIAAGILTDKGLVLGGDPSVVVAQAPTGQRSLAELNAYVASLPALQVEAETEKESTAEPPQSQ